MSEPNKRAVKATAGLFVVFALLVSTHLGEFWPFSIYPMFSQGGKPWNRAIVRQVDANYAIKWDTIHTIDQLKGKAYPVVPLGLSQNDFANYVNKTKVWDAKKIHGIQNMFNNIHPDSALIIYQAKGKMLKNKDIELAFVPFFKLNRDGYTINPKLAAE